MHEAKINFACPKCKQATAAYISTVKLNTFECSHCHERLYADALPRLAHKLSKELCKLFKRHANAYFYTRIEFERDYECVDDTNIFFSNALKAFQDKDALFTPPRFEILAYQFKCKNTAVRMLLHDDSIAHPDDYLIPTCHRFSYKFSEVTDEPYLPVSSKDTSKERDDEFLGLYLFDYADLIHYTRLYNAYLRAFSQTHRTFACLEC
ncbi:hypothetical protein [Campylobacter sp. 7477a]|uniref:hypothetical protein n=1 Tax=Campylobacter sp. 7477a TaxID=2735741 RepID=UPI003014D925|nr:hypothetical protein [Campylobacter sp. 7477a]